MSVFWGSFARFNGTKILVPADVISREIWEKLPEGKDIQVEAKVPRNSKFHRLVFALFGLIAKAFDEDAENVRHKVMVSIGEYQEIDCGPADITPAMIQTASLILYGESELDRTECDRIAKRMLQSVMVRQVDRRPNSLSYANMDNERFREFFERLVKGVYAIYGMLPGDTKREVDLILAPKTEKYR